MVHHVPRSADDDVGDVGDDDDDDDDEESKQV